METPIYSPLSEYKNKYKQAFDEAAERTFSKLASLANIDAESNERLCNEIDKIQKQSNKIKSSITQWNILRWSLWILVIGALIVAIAGWNNGMAFLLVPITLVTLLNLLNVTPEIKRLKTERTNLEETIEQKKNIAWQQMHELNKLFDWDIFARMATQVMPNIQFDPFFSTKRLTDLRHTYGWDDKFNSERSVIYSQSGLINGNPFVICRTRKLEIGSKTYTGSKTIHWTTQELGSDGKYHTRHHSETLTAHVTAPFPLYPEKTILIYGNTAAPDLTFYRKQNDLAGNEKSLSFKWNLHKLRKKARNFTKYDFAMLTNEDFEVVFNTSNRNNNQQFALLFTPLAQQAMTDLLTDEENIGYGDDFDFHKDHKINNIIPDHLQEIVLDFNPDNYRHYSLKTTRHLFITKNAEYFKALYFALAPLLCIPLYQQIRPASEIYANNYTLRSSFWEHEALANYWGQRQFQHPNCCTSSILKTSERDLPDGSRAINVEAYGFKAIHRTTYISKYGGDGHMHEVAVHWDEFVPVVGNGSFILKDDVPTHSSSYTDQRQRIQHIANMLYGFGRGSIYRRNIASRMTGR